MDFFERDLTIERAAIDTEAGTFPMILATEGEASDGHILSIRGMNLPERMPLLYGHDGNRVLGSVVEMHKGRSKGVPVIRGTGRIEMEGEGSPAEARRDINHLVGTGDIDAVSVRWDSIKAVSRTSLPENHAAHVPANDETEKRFGYFFEKSRAREGSVVALGSDLDAKIGRMLGASDEIHGTMTAEECEAIVNTRIAESLEYLRALQARQDEVEAAKHLPKGPAVTQSTPHAAMRSNSVLGLSPKEFMRQLGEQIEGNMAEVIKRSLGRSR